MAKRFIRLLFLTFSVWVLVNCAGAKAVSDKPIDVSEIKAKPFTQTSFLKEWALKKIEYEGPIRMVSLTANKYGVYVLAKTDFKYLPKKKEEMSEEDKKYAGYRMESYFGRAVTDEERNQYIQYFAEEVKKESYYVLHYSHNGDFITQWIGEIEGEKLNHPLKIASDTSGNIYISDYGVNRIKKFTHEGKSLLWWKINPEKGVNVNIIGNLEIGGLYIFQHSCPK